MPTAKVLTRRELYDLIWSKPVTEVAAELGISDVGLAKICDRHRVPKPSRGYWAKLQAGKKVKQTIFREVDDAALNRIEIGSAHYRLPPAAREIIERAKAERREAKPSSKTTVEPASIVPVTEIHPLITLTAKALRKVRPDENGAVQAFGDGRCGVDVAAANVERVIAFLDALARRLEAKGIPFEPTGQGMQVAVGTDTASFTLKERTRREEHIPTPQELAAEERREKRRQRYWQSSRAWDIDTSDLYGRVYPQFDTVYTGALVFQVDGYDDGLRRKWADGKRQRIETLLDNIVIGLKALLALRKAQREEHEEQQRQWRELARRRELARKRTEREDQRLSYLNSALKVQDEIAQLHQWLTQITVADETLPTGNVARMVEWTRQRLASLEAMADPANIERDLEDKNLFPAVDELHDPQGEPRKDRYGW